MQLMSAGYVWCIKSMSMVFGLLTKQCHCLLRVAILQVCDFNLSDILEDCDGCIPGGDPISPPWSAPERLIGKDFGMPADVYSFGIVLWELIMLGESTSSSKAQMCCLGQIKRPFVPSPNLAV